jgi:hypothetical protein
MATKFEEVNLGNIEQGNFMEAAEAAFKEVCSSLIAHQATYGKDAAAKLTLGVSIAGKNGAFVLTTDIAKALPKKPAVMTTAMAERDVHGELCLFAQTGGTNKGPDPRQAVLCGDDGTPLQ